AHGVCLLLEESLSAPRPVGLARCGAVQPARSASTPRLPLKTFHRRNRVIGDQGDQGWGARRGGLAASLPVLPNISEPRDEGASPGPAPPGWRPFGVAQGTAAKGRAARGARAARDRRADLPQRQRPNRAEPDRVDPRAGDPEPGHVRQALLLSRRWRRLCAAPL